MMGRKNNTKMKFSPDQINYLCLTKFSDIEFIFFKKRLERYLHYIVNEKMTVIVTKDGPKDVFKYLAGTSTEQEKINLIQLEGSSLYGIPKETFYDEDYKSVFDKSP